MIEFMVIAHPRSGTTWAANWLTTDQALCLHDPLAYKHYSTWDKIESKKTLGVSDCGIQAFPDFLNSHPARKVILHRDREEIAESLGFPEFMNIPYHLDTIDGMHVHFTDLWENPQPIYEYLLQRPFDAERHAELKHMQIQPKGAELLLDKSVVRQLFNELRNEVRHA